MKRLVLLLLLLLPALAGAEEKELRLFCWANYIPRQILYGFEKETGIKTNYATFENNESMYAKLKLTQKEGYDLAFPSTYYVNRMKQQKMLRPINKTRLENFKHLDPALLNKPYDPENTFSIPYLWGTTAIGVNKRFIDPVTIKGWKDLWRPEFKNRVLLTNDMREVFAMGLQMAGYSGNSRNPAEIEAAYKKLRALKPNIRLFSADSIKMPFLNEEVHLGLIWNGDLFLARQDDPDLAYVYPEEGTIVWLDSMVIPHNAAHPENALRFIDYVSRPEVAREISTTIGYASPNKTAVSMMPEKIKNDPIVYPPPEVLERGEFQEDVGEAVLVYEKFWERLKVE